ncbi:4'-phosphopantetheinyl transferase family protein [Dysgonomonas sp. Marseille-P4361]|uniref:4'-phosphopantetheinyl transferase family protein n=1 Tax=Dysgonomonas sp. Marseille-P4361 TaxID=2161820 RepID=UPI000D55F1BD|nr:4'-phosphopantetheinyl transferase family protein [Dysgonomonas sp. Marseille-P4361]
MLYLKEYITESTLIGIWKIEESRELLLAMLSCQEWVQHILTIKSESRVLEILAARILLKELIGEEKEVYYTNSGKPFLMDKSFHISVSHTKGYVAVAVNKEKEIGLDIEQISEKIKRVQSRIVSDKEYIDPQNEFIHLLLHWSAKEAMFKFIDREGVNFLENLFVDKFTPEDKGYFYASETRTEERNRFKACYQIEKEFIIVCLEAC